MPVYTLNPSHRRASSRASGPSLRERVAAKRRNPGAHDLAAVEARLKFLRDEIHMDSDEADREFSRLLAKYKSAGGAVKRVGGPYPGTSFVLVGSEVAKWQAAGKRQRKNPLSEDGVVVSNPAKRRVGGRSAQKAGLAKGQSLMAQAAAAYRAGKYASMQDALRGVARGGSRKRNGLSEDGMVVSNPSKRGKGKAKRTGGRTAAQSNAARAMKMFHSGKASSLAEAWDMIRSGR